MLTLVEMCLKQEVQKDKYHLFSIFAPLQFQRRTMIDELGQCFLLMVASDKGGLRG